MKNQPIASRLAETLALLVIWPISITISAGYLLISCTLNIILRLMEVWE